MAVLRKCARRACRGAGRAEVAIGSGERAIECELVVRVEALSVALRAIADIAQLCHTSEPERDRERKICERKQVSQHLTGNGLTRSSGARTGAASFESWGSSSWHLHFHRDVARLLHK
jgi:hypothetical protein